MIAAKQMVF